MARFRLAVEDVEPNHWVAFVLGLPGCFSAAHSQAEAIAQAPQQINQYAAWLAAHGAPSPVVDQPVEVELAETFHAYESEVEPGYLVNAFFSDDRRPLGPQEVETALRLMAWTRQDLLSLVLRIGSPGLEAARPGERFKTVEGVLQHVALAENWYLDRMGLGLEQDDLPPGTFDRLAVVRENAVQQLPKLVDDGRIGQESGESWSGRKVVRRLLWHEKDHTGHIRQLLR